ncbi:MAG: hypothetical protein IJ144_04990 [Prevotella sp.]|nr:hypothetical protein [Prevotella sp.]
MKKTYIIPDVQEIRIETVSLIAASIETKGELSSSGKLLGRQGFFDDEED